MRGERKNPDEFPGAEDDYRPGCVRASLIILILKVSRAQTLRIERGRGARVPAIAPGAPGGTISV